MAPTSAGQEAGPSRKKARRGSRHGETVTPSHYGPVACTSATAALVQAYLAIDTATSAAAAVQQQQPNGCSSSAKGGKSNSTNGGDSDSKSSSITTNSSNNKSALPATGDSSSPFLYMSESTFDPVKRRFGGKSKPVTFANSRASGKAAAGAGSSSSSSSSSKGPRLSFGQGTKLVATREAMHATLHCRCVFVLLCELASSSCGGGTGGKASSPNAGAAGAPGAAAAGAATTKNSSADTAHLITLSPDDLFCALSVDSFPLLVPTEAGATAAGGGGGGSGRRGQRQHQTQAPAAAGALPRAFEVVDGPAIIHRPAARQGEPWRGLEVFRPEPAAGPWRGHRVPLPAADGIGEEENGDIDGGSSRPGSIFGSLRGRGGNRGGAAFRLNLSPASAVDDDDAAACDLIAATPPSQQSGAGARSKKRTVGVDSSPLMVCPPMASFSAPGNGVATDCFSYGPGNGLGGNSRGCDETEAAVVALPPSRAATACAAVEQGDEAEDPPPQWMSLSVDREGRASLSSCRGLPKELKIHPTCLCRAPDIDSGMVSLAAGARGEGAAAGQGGLVLRSLPPTVYMGVAVGGGRNGLDTNGEADGARARGGGGALLELQGGTLSCSRLLPAPPSSVMTAAVDDAQGVLVVLLADQARTALLLARDGSDLPVVEQHRGIAAAFAGDFLGSGREQVALLCSASSAGGSGGGGGSGGTGRAGKRGAASAAAAVKAGVGGWEQLPLKALMKRAVVTDCSLDWENGRRDGSAAAASGGGGSGSGSANGRQGGAGSQEAFPAKATSKTTKESPNGKKRPRSMEAADNGADDEVGKAASGSPGAAAEEERKSSKDKSNRGADSEGSGVSRLSNIVQVVRRRVCAEETRLLRLRQARRGKATVLEAAKLALAAQVGAGGEEDTAGSRLGTADLSTGSVARAFVDGLVAPGGGRSTMPSPGWIDGRADETSPYPPPRPHTPLECTVVQVRFHAPSRTLCLDAHISNPAVNDAAGLSMVVAGPPAMVVGNVCLSVASASGCLTTRSAVCPRLCPGESATVRACVDVPFSLLASGGGAPASLFASCTWSVSDNDVAATNGTKKSHTTAVAPAAAATVARDSDKFRSSCSLIFSRFLVSPQDMLGMGGALSSTALVPKTEMRQGSSSSTGGGGGRRKNKGAVSTGYSGSGRSIIDGTPRHLGLFDVGTRLDLLLRSDSSTTTTSLASLPQAVRSLSKVAALPEPWAGGAAVQVHSCSERAAACTLRAGDSTSSSSSSPAVLLAVAAGALPDGARGSADHASEQGLALVTAAAAALQDEMTALEAVARERGRMGAGAGSARRENGSAGGDSSSSGAGGGKKTTAGLAAALEWYRASQMKSDLLAAKLAARVVAAQGRAPLGDRPV